MSVTLGPNTKRAEWIRTAAKPAIIVTLIGALAVALLVPHLVDGHILSLSVAQTQSLLIAIDLLVAGALITILNRQIVREKLEKQTLQHRLTRSFRYIGQANVCLELIKEHSAALARSRSTNESHGVLSDLHGAIASGVAGAAASRLRVISVDTMRTVTEYVWTREGGSAAPPISNKLALSKQSPQSGDSAPLIIRSGYQEGGIVCVLAAVTSERNGGDDELLNVLLNHFHLLFLFVHDHHKESR